MHENDWNSAGIVRLQKIEARFLHPVAASQGAHQIGEEQVFRRPEVGDGGGKIGFERSLLSFHSCERVTARSPQGQCSICSVKIESGGNRRSHSFRWRKLFLLRNRANSNQGTTDTVVGYLFFNQCTLDLIRVLERREIIRRPGGGGAAWLEPQMVGCALVSECEPMIPQTSPISRTKA